MVHFEAMTAESRALFGDACDRFMGFDSPVEYDLLCKTAAARSDWRRDHYNDPLPEDIDLAKFVPARLPGMYTNFDGVEGFRELLEVFADRTWENSRHWHPVRQATDRQRARDLSAQLLVESRWFDEIVAISSDTIHDDDQSG